MPKVFISYRQIDETQRKRVRAFAERLRGCKIEVTLDQFYLDEHPGGPPDGWDKWSSDRALKSDYVLIIGTESWFQCFEKTQQPGTGLGAACEADDLRYRIYKANGIIENIRVAVFDDADARHISFKLKGYHRFNADRDFNNIVNWLGGTIPIVPHSESVIPRSSIPHNLPTLQPFFGREEELKKIADALDPDSRTWGALIDGPGGMGKTSLGVRAAYDASPEDFKRIIFISLKTRELDDDGVRDLSGFLISGLAELFGELARELGRDDIAKAAEEQRPRSLLEALRGTQTLLVLDNLESLIKPERDTLFTFVKKLPTGCKAILTSRGRIGSGAEELILEKLSEEAALATLADLATHNPLLAQTNEAERLVLYRETAGKPLLLRWTAGQIGRGHCLTFTDALHFLRSCPPGNDPLEFVFGDLVDDFSEDETKVICALTYFTQPAAVKHIAELADPQGAGLAKSGDDSKRHLASAAPWIAAVEQALRSLVNRSLAVPNDELTAFTLVPMVADFLRKKKPEVVAETGDRLEKRAYALIIENGKRQHARFPILDTAWPMVAPALPRLVAGSNQRLQQACRALTHFLDYTGRWDERLFLFQRAEEKALAACDFSEAGKRAYQVCLVYYRRRQIPETKLWANRAAENWHRAEPTARQLGDAIRLKGLYHFLEGNYAFAIKSHSEALQKYRSASTESRDIVICLSSLAEAQRAIDDLQSAKANLQEALRIAKSIGELGEVTTVSGELAELALDIEDWKDGEALAREALALSQKLGRQVLIARNSLRLANALVRQGKAIEALPNARRAVEIYTRLGLPGLAEAQAILDEFEAQLAKP